MDSASMDHYEKQLYSVFKTFDVDNEEALNRSAVLDLCDALQLEDRGAALAGELFDRGGGERVTFSQFRNGLLSVLGAAPPPAPAAPAPPPAPPPPASDDDSSGREVAPRLVVGAKKYGRRSRPHTPAAAAAPEPLAAPPGTPPGSPERVRRRMKCKRSALAMDAHGDASDSSPRDELDHERRVDCEHALDLCRQLDMDGIDRRLVESVFEDAASAELTVGEFFDRLNSTLSTSMASSVPGAGAVQVEAAGDAGALAAADVAQAWEACGVSRARRLLRELGFPAPALCGAALARALDAELGALPAPPPAERQARALLRAALALQRLRGASQAAAADSARAEAAKLRADLAEANRRAAALAQDVDENHARIEGELHARLRQLARRRADEARAQAQELAAESERAAAAEARADEAGAATVRARAEAAAARELQAELAARATQAEENAARVLAAKEALELELRTLRERGDAGPAAGAAAPAEAEVAAAARELAVAAALAELRRENKLLRDRNDELGAALEGAGMGAGAAGVGGDAGGAASWRDEAGLRGSDCVDECDHSLVSLDQKVFGHIEVVKRLQNVLENISQVSLTDNSGCECCGILKGIILMIQERVQELSDSVILADHTGLRLNTSAEVSVQTESDDREEVTRLNKLLEDNELKYADEKQRLSNLVKDLETSLDQMKSEYDKCEEYWTNKLDEERDIYNEEQKMSDERLNQLIAKISEYEQQFEPKSNSSTLPTIDEKYSLEIQFTDLEQEFDSFKKEKTLELTNKDKEITELKEQIKSLEQRPTNGEVSSPIEYLWNQGTINSPYNKRDYQNPAFSRRTSSNAEDVQCNSDGERSQRAVSPIRRPASQPRSASAGPLEAAHMLTCADVEGQLRQQAQRRGAAHCLQGGGGGAARTCECAALEQRCLQLVSALRHRQMCLDAVQQSARSEGSALRARVAAAEAAVARLQSRLAAADLLVKDLYLENCQLAQHTRLL